jgi:ferredoxin
MANKTNAWRDNAPGAWYVDKDCILCGLCENVAPHNFKEAASGDHFILIEQPEDDAERVQCLDAMEQCPVEAIGNDME